MTEIEIGDVVEFDKDRNECPVCKIGCDDEQDDVITCMADHQFKWDLDREHLSRIRDWEERDITTRIDYPDPKFRLSEENEKLFQKDFQETLDWDVGDIDPEDPQQVDITGMICTNIKKSDDSSKYIVLELTDYNANDVGTLEVYGWETVKLK